MEVESLKHFEKIAAERIQALAISENDLILQLHKMKQLVGRQGVKAFLKDQLRDSGLIQKTSADRILLNLNTAEYLMEMGIPFEEFKEIPISKWTQIRKFVTRENIEIIKKFILRSGTVQSLILSFRNGKNIYEEIFTENIELR